MTALETHLVIHKKGEFALETGVAALEAGVFALEMGGGCAVVSYVELDEGAERGFVGEPAAVGAEAAAGLAARVRVELDLGWEIEELRQLRTRGGQTVDHNQDPADALVLERGREVA